MKERACKYGERINGKCPPKPKTQTKKKGRPCKYGERINGKCPPKPKNVSVKAKKPSAMKKGNIQVIFYENDKQINFDQFSRQELQSIFNKITDMFNKIADENIKFKGEIMILENVKYNNTTIENKYPLNEKIPVTLSDIYGVSKWGKIEFMFKIAEEEPTTTDVEFKIYNNNKLVSYKEIHMRDEVNIDSYLHGQLTTFPTQIKFIYNSGNLLIKNVPYYKNSKIIGRSIEDGFPVNKKITDERLQGILKRGELADYWKKVTIMFKTIKTT